MEREQKMMVGGVTHTHTRLGWSPAITQALTLRISTQWSPGRSQDRCGEMIYYKSLI